MALVIDIETIPGQRDGLREKIAESVAPPGNMKKADTIAKWEAEEKPACVEEAYRKTGLDGGYGEALCIGWAVDDGEIQSMSRRIGDDEGEFLQACLTEIANQVGYRNDGLCRSVTWVGHNLVGFDLRFLWQRCVVNRVNSPIRIPVTAKPWDDTVFDTMTEWAGVRGSVSLAKLGDIFGIGKLDGMDGSQVYELALAGQYARIEEYCRKDVEITREAYRRMQFR